ncbi:pyruvate flavodoxin/ferredoxin oxidoreductase domain protein [Thermosinus carboxydivorans Nor1]|uniref:Pyruvate flavodoxin/ferredoxin oxidoreductase domain protein n=1 Tax=Thermosinus carboxydivorans Nor1 TaxID=401526 RepID=A1HTT7_9FIRM|nr:3-methyl-2-oxobutanoate dehydrogenase subunit VorB [Thermosinus carboxydivorans]EAX46571.1 pyruvate flavodoxin/ferredoxin oxidoreductase domain protein [Thermosinus carboxydivorans Nor1]
MAEKVLMKGNEAIGEAAIVAGCRHYFGYPITPQTELTEYMAKRMPQVGGVFLQAESEIAAINMVYGAAGAGARVMTSSSSPGISLKQEGISYIAGAELPCVIVNIMRGGPGLGGIQPGQADYFQATKGGGHGDYHNIVLAPNSVQELVDITILAFDLADQYRNPVMILGDGALGQMMEPVEFNTSQVSPVEKPWAATGMKGGRKDPNIINSLHLQPDELEKHNIHLQKKYQTIRDKERRYEELYTDDAELILVAYGITSRIARSAMEKARAAGMKVGMLRPITLWPFPDLPFNLLAQKAHAFLTIELSAGQMVEDVRLAVNGAKPVYFYGRMGGMMPSPKAVYEQIVNIMSGKGGK